MSGSFQYCGRNEEENTALIKYRRIMFDVAEISVSQLEAL